MHTCASNSELVEPLPEPEHTLNRRLRRRNRRIPFDQRNNPPQNPRIFYSLIININYFRYFLDILQNYYPMDDKPMWAADRVFASTPGSAITIPETANEFSIKALFDRLHGEIRAFSQHENEFLTDAWLRMKEMLRNCDGHNLSKGNIIKIFYHGLHKITQEVLNAAVGGIFLYKTSNQAYQLLEDKVLVKLDWAKNQKTKLSLKKTVAFADEDAQYKELQSRAKKTIPCLDDNDIPMSREEEEAKFMQTFHKTRFYNDYRDRDLNRDNWRLSGRNDYNRINYQSNTDDKPYDKQSGRPSRSLPSNTQLNPRGGNSKAYQPPQSCNEHVNAVFTKSADLGASINLIPYSLYAKLSHETLKPTKMTVRLADRSFQYPVGIAKNMLVEVGKFTFPADFVILEMEEDIKVPLILGRPFLHTADAVIRVKQKQLNLGVGTKRMIFNIDSAMKHSYSNDDICFSIDVIDEILEEDFDALLDERSKILHFIEGTLLEEEIFFEFDDIMAMTVDENSESESNTEEPPFEKITINTDYKIKTSLEEPPTDLELKPLPDNLEYVFLEEPSFLLEKCHFIVKEGIVLGHKVPGTGLEIDKAKIDISKIARPLTKLLEKDTPFEFDDECQKAFELLKEKLTCAHVIVSPNWNLPFELMCDVSDFAVGIVLRQKDGKTFIVNGHRLKLYHEEEYYNDQREAVTPFFPKE
ncbi:reverse transcriptase domain-containing protein [Tanacetum coccineum]